MSQEVSNLSLLQLSRDMEWMNALHKGLQRFFIVKEKNTDSLENLAHLLQQTQQVDMVIVSATPDLPTVDKVKGLLAQMGISVPVMVVTPTAQATDEFVKAGADYVVARNDIITAINNVRHIAQVANFFREKIQAEKNYQAFENRYNRIFEDVPDPICYIQDGLFLGANPAFLNVFKVKDLKELDTMTIMNFVSLKSDRTLKQLIKLAAEKDVVPAESLEMHDTTGENVEVMAQVSQVFINNEPAVQMYLKTASGGAAIGGGGVDPTTGLGSPSALRAAILQTQERSEEHLLGTWIYFWVENYREVFLKDGHEPAEIMMHAVVETAQRLLPPSTQMARFSDDAILIWVTGDKEQTVKRFYNLITRLDEMVPEDIGRLVHPHTFAGMQELRRDSEFEDLLSKSYRAVRGLAAGQTQERVAEPASADISRKDERRLYAINQMLENNLMQWLYQPITSVQGDGVARYADVLTVLPNPDRSVDDEELEIDTILGLAERFKLGRNIDRAKINQFCQDFLSYGGDQRGLHIFLSICADALSDPDFPSWVENQLESVGLQPHQVIFDFRFDVAHGAYSGAQHLVDLMRPQGSKFAISEIGRFDEEIQEVFNLLKPEVIKLDMREISTFDYEEEDKFMRDLRNYIGDKPIMVIAGNVRSAAQLASIYPHGIHYLQGKGVVESMREFSYDFNDTLF